MGKLIHIGFGNVVNEDRIVAIVHPEAAPVRRLVTHAKEADLVVDATQGRKTRSVIVMDGRQIVLSALLPETILSRAGERPAAESQETDTE
ncbi:MAG: DUF370 domain-containing protein [Lachnospiraceae bacterium]|nr:DUF370 domain-containing protein [Lachnospiraceae bacterium]